jgi:hypothetical protein
MFKKLIASLGIGAAAVVPGIAAEPPGPYPQTEINFIYNLLFCDNPARFRPRDGEQPTPWQRLLFNDKPDARAVAALAEDQTQESRVRVLAYNWLSRNHHPVPKRKLLGVVVEVRFDAGLDTLAAYQDGRIRYINQTGKLAVFEAATPDMEAKVARLLAASQTAVDRLGPWGKPRLPPPSNGNVRLTFLVSDGLYFGEGPFSAMQREPVAAPIIQEASELLQLVVNAVTK